MDSLQEIKKSLHNIENTISLLIPNSFSISSISQISGKSRQTIRQHLINNYEPEVDFYKKSSKIFMSTKTALNVLRKYNES